MGNIMQEASAVLMTQWTPETISQMYFDGILSRKDVCVLSDLFNKIVDFYGSDDVA